MGGYKERFFGILLVVGILFAASFVFAAVVVTRTDLTTNAFNYNEDLSLLYNITVNATVGSLANAQANNITQVNITFPSSFVFLANVTNGTSSVAGVSFSNNILRFVNLTAGVVNASAAPHYFWMNATATTPGIYNITVVSSNATNIYNTNLTVRVNDTVVPAVSAGNITLVNRVNVSGGIILNVSVADNSLINYVAFNLSNSSGDVRIINSTNPTEGYWNSTLSTSSFTDGVYNLTILVNDTYGSVNHSTYIGSNLNNSAIIEIIIDNTAPTAVISCTPSTVDQDDTVTCSCSGTDALSGINTSTVSTTPSTSETGTFSVACGVTDLAGNTASASASYTVESSGGGSGGSGGNGPSLSPAQPSWRTALVESDQNLADKGTVTRSLGARDRVQVKIADVIHHVGVVSVSSTGVVIEVSSTPQQATFAVGETKKFEVSGDNYYDMSVTLVSINAGKAQVSMRQINEIMPSTPSPVATTAQEGSALKPTRSALWGWVAGFIVVGGLVGCVLYLRKKR